MKLLLEYYKNNNILDRYSSGMGFGDGRLILDNDVMNVLDNIEEKIFIEPLNKKIGKDKEIDRLNNVINELEKWLKEDLKEVYRDAGYRNNIINEVLVKLKELKENKQ